jgi:DNA (cytosine-5)-methyltransferase 1
MAASLKAIDLFSGCGGLTQGLKEAGYSVLAGVEIDPKARKTYSLNHPETPLIGNDIRQLGADQLLQELGLKSGQLDLLAGCPPCQGFSTLRTRSGQKPAEDKRNDLIDDFSRLAFALMPKMIMMENVPALAKFTKFLEFVSSLEHSGYTVIYQVLDVSGFGVPQRRKRLILSASRVGAPKLAQSMATKISVRDAIGSLPKAGLSGDPLHDITSEGRTKRVQEIIEAIPKNGGSRHSLPAKMKLACHMNTDGFNDVYGRMSWDEVSPTITSGCTNPSKGRFIHPEENRPITLREAALLQGFPEDYKFEISHGKGAISLMIGNALPPPFIAMHSKAMAEGLTQ